MPAELPIACSLSASEFPLRETEIAALGRDALIDARQDAIHAELRFAAGDGVRARVEAFVAKEASCCGFLAMRVTEEPDVVLLTIDAPEDAEVVLGELVEAFHAEPQAAP
jgi:hypothetical protein